LNVDEKIFIRNYRSTLSSDFRKTLKTELDFVEARDLPGGIILTGGAAATSGIVDLAEDMFGINVKTLCS